MGCAKLPEHIRRIAANQEFSFSCRPGVSCFTECCRELELALTPYDLLRLRRATGLSSTEFLDRYVIIEEDEHDVFPRCYLGMVDDGRASCVFVSASGCTVYSHRPGACRAYPLGRGTGVGRHGTHEVFVLVQEPHCRGFGDSEPHDAAHYMKTQGLTPYNRFNDRVAHILQHPEIRRGKTLCREEKDAYILALYDIDRFRSARAAGSLGGADDAPVDAAGDDELLLDYAIDWLFRKLFTAQSAERC